MIKIEFDKSHNKSVAYDNGKQVGICEFIESDEYWNIVHTEVNESHKGQGIARKLVECIIENVKKYNKKIVSDCSYAKNVIEKN